MTISILVKKPRVVAVLLLVEVADQLTSKNRIPSIPSITSKTRKVANINTALAAATCALPGIVPSVQADEAVWEMDSALFY